MLLALAATGGPAQSRSLHVTGTAGYLSEWELDGEIISDAAPGNELVGRLVWKHVGLCSVNGPQERTGDIRVRLPASASSTVDAKISFDRDQCTYRGPASGSGRMDCRDAGGIPLSISIK
jgi:hypothetical protein